QAREHTAGIRANRKLNVVSETGKLDYLGSLGRNFLQRHAEKHAAGNDVVVSGIFHLQTGGLMQQWSDMPLDRDPAGARSVNAGKDSQQSGLPCAIAADQPD